MDIGKDSALSGVTAAAPAAAECVFDVVVVGGGGTGLAAAIEARNQGRHVALIEKNPVLGGSTGRSIGSISATNTPHQIRHGIKDCPEHHSEDLAKFNSVCGFSDNAELRRVLTSNVPETVRWLMSMGVRFYGPMPEPPHRLPRMHNVLPNSGAYIYHLERHARRIGVDIFPSMPAKRLIRREGRVVGVETEDPSGRRHVFIGRGGVVLASGDYSANEDFKARFTSRDIARIGPTTPTNTGDGHQMAMEMGGKVLNGAFMAAVIKCVAPKRKKFVHLLPPATWMTGFINWSMENLPPRILRPFVMSFMTTVLSISPKLFEAGALLVNQQGRRFGDELETPVLSISRQTEQTAYFIFDSAIAKRFSAWPHFVSTAPGIAYAYVPDYRRTRPDIVKVARSPEALARKMGVPADALRDTFDAYNAGTDGIGTATRDKRWHGSLSEPPFYALGPVKSVVNLTDGGLAINAQMQVLGEDDQPIPGLYAAGSAGQGGLLLEGHGHHLGWAFTSGRIAGRNAAYSVVSEPTVAAS